VFERPRNFFAAYVSAKFLFLFYGRTYALNRSLNLVNIVPTWCMPVEIAVSFDGHHLKHVLFACGYIIFSIQVP